MSLYQNATLLASSVYVFFLFLYYILPPIENDINDEYNGTFNVQYWDIFNYAPLTPHNTFCLSHVIPIEASLLT